MSCSLVGFRSGLLVSKERVRKAFGELLVTAVLFPFLPPWAFQELDFVMWGWAGAYSEACLSLLVLEICGSSLQTVKEIPHSIRLMKQRELPFLKLSTFEWLFSFVSFFKKTLNHIRSFFKSWKHILFLREQRWFCFLSALWQPSSIVIGYQKCFFVSCVQWLQA